MNLEIALATQLASSVTAVGGRVYPMVIPQGEPLPCITYQRISTPRQYVLGSSDVVTNARMQIDCWGSSYSSAKTVATAALTALNQKMGDLGTGTKTFKVLVSLADNEADSYEEDTGRYRVRIDFRIMYEE